MGNTDTTRKSKEVDSKVHLLPWNSNHDVMQLSVFNRNI